jgi:hypothetical protein
MVKARQRPRRGAITKTLELECDVTKTKMTFGREANEGTKMKCKFRTRVAKRRQIFWGREDEMRLSDAMKMQ